MRKGIYILAVLALFLFVPTNLRAATVNLNLSFDPGKIFQQVPQESVMVEEGRNVLFAYEVNAPDDLMVRFKSQYFTFYAHNVDLSALQVKVYKDENFENPVVESGYFLVGRTLEGKKVKLLLPEVRVPRGESYYVVLSGNISSAEDGGFLSIWKKGVGAYVLSAFRRF